MDEGLEPERRVSLPDMVGQLAGRVAHDFNNLLAVILGHASLMLAALPPDDPKRAGLEEIQRAGARAGTLTQQLLAYSRQQLLQPRVIDLNQLLANMQPRLRGLLGDCVALNQAFPSEPSWVCADPGALEQVVIDLFSNARDALRGSGEVRIEIAQTAIGPTHPAAKQGLAPGRYARLAVTDTGVGMSDATRARIFEPFFSTKDRQHATGLGLSCVQGNVVQSGGHVVVQSELGVGTTVEVLLPSCAPAAHGGARPQSLPVRSPQGAETILVVDDEAPVRQIMRAILRRQGYEVLDAASGSEAYLICERHTARIHMLLTDMLMPTMSGRELAGRVRGLRPDVRVLYVSGYTEDPLWLSCELDAHSAFLPKPFTPSELLHKIRELLDAGS